MMVMVYDEQKKDGWAGFACDSQSTPEH